MEFQGSFTPPLMWHDRILPHPHPRRKPDTCTPSERRKSPSPGVARPCQILRAHALPPDPVRLVNGRRNPQTRFFSRIRELPLPPWAKNAETFFTLAITE